MASAVYEAGYRGVNSSSYYVPLSLNNTRSWDSGDSWDQGLFVALFAEQFRSFALGQRGQLGHSV